MIRASTYDTQGRQQAYNTANIETTSNARHLLLNVIVLYMPPSGGHSSGPLLPHLIIHQVRQTSPASISFPSPLPCASTPDSRLNASHSNLKIFTPPLFSILDLPLPTPLITRAIPRLELAIHKDIPISLSQEVSLWF
jgi:hypothetical protein